MDEEGIEMLVGKFKTNQTYAFEKVGILLERD